MMSALRWIRDALLKVISAVVGLASSVTSWIIAGLTAVAVTITDQVAALFEAALPEIEWPELFTGSGLLFGNLAHALALDDAVHGLVVLATAWGVARLARLAMVPIRALLEIL